MSRIFNLKAPACNTDRSPAELPGLSKPSFSLPFNGGEIRFEHLDGIFQYSDRAIEKLQNDRKTFCPPSSPALIAVVLFDTQITEELIEALVHSLCDGPKLFRRAAFIGLCSYDIKRLKHRLPGTASFQYSFINGIEQAKNYLLP